MSVIVRKKRLINKKDKCKKQGIPYVYDRKWRDAKELEIPKNIKKTSHKI